MKVGIVIPTYDRFAEGGVFRDIVGQLEDLGYDSAWFGDHIAFPAERPEYLGDSWLDAMACASAGLGMTTRLTFGTDVLVAPYRNPVLLAKMASTASVLSGGRLILGLGIGWLEGEFEAVGAPPFSNRARVTEEYLSVMRLLWESEGEVSFEGEWIRFANVTFEPRPAKTLPLLMGGNHEKALRRAVLYGDGWHPLFLEPEEYAQCRAKIEGIREEEGITRPFQFSMSGSQCRILGNREQQGHKHVVAEEGTSYAPAVATDESGRQRFIGTADEVREDCLALAKAGVEQLVLRIALPMDSDIGIHEHREQLRLFAQEVLPALQAV